MIDVSIEDKVSYAANVHLAGNSKPRKDKRTICRLGVQPTNRVEYEGKGD